MKKNTYFILGILLIVLVGFISWKYFSDKRVVIIDDDSPKENITEKITYTNASDDVISVELPFPGAVVGKKFSVLGKARGNWFFEASFPVEVLDKDGKVLASGVAQAKSDWMTTNFVEFKADLSVPESYIGKGTLILKKDNPSGMPEKDASISFPINIEY